MKNAPEVGSLAAQEESLRAAARRRPRAWSAPEARRRDGRSARIGPEPEPARHGLHLLRPADNAAVEPVVVAVKDAGRDVWIDKGGIQPGENWAGEIVRGIKGAKGVDGDVLAPRPSKATTSNAKSTSPTATRSRCSRFSSPRRKPPEDFEVFLRQRAMAGAVQAAGSRPFRCNRQGAGGGLAGTARPG